MKDLNSTIRDIIQKEIRCDSKSSMKKRIFEECATVQNMEANVAHAMEEIELSVNQRVAIKERILLFIAQQSKTFTERMFESLLVRRVGSAMSVFVLVALLVLQPFASITTVKAYTPTRITTLSGTVIVSRDGTLLRGKADLPLLEGDVIQTGPNAFVEVVFADDSVLRMNNSGHLVVDKLSNTVLNSITRLNLNKGEIWVNSLGLSGSEASLTVNSQDLMVATNTKSVFNLVASLNTIKVVALENSLNLQLYHTGEYLPTVLKRGELIKVKKDTQVNTYLNQQSFDDHLSDFNLDWIVSNYQQDQFYLESLSENRIIDLRKKIRITPDSYFYSVKELQRKAKLAMTLNPVKQVELELLYANERLLEAELLLNKGDTVNAKKSLNEYSKDLSRVKEKVNKLDSNSKSEEIKQLKDSLSDAVSIQKKVVEDILPSEEKYDMKETIKEAEIMVAETVSAKIKVKLDHLNGGLKEIKSLIEQENSEMAIAMLLKYVQEIEDLDVQISLLDEKEKIELMPILLDANAKRLSILELLSESKQVDVDEIEEPTEELDMSDEQIDETNETESIEDENLLEEDLNEKGNDRLDSNLEELLITTQQKFTETLEEAANMKDPVVLDKIKQLSETVDSKSLNIQDIAEVKEFEDFKNSSNQK